MNLVSYAYHGSRGRDAILALLIPPLSLWLGLRFAWRLAYLPHRDWMPRPDEAESWVQVRHPGKPGELLYVRA